MYICATVLVLAGFMSLAGPVFRFHLMYKKPAHPEPENGFSIVVAFRNERTHLPALYQSICELNYPPQLIEWVLCNDHSDDEGRDWILQTAKTAPFSMVYCENSEMSGKKAALALGVQEARFETVFFTDADCILPNNLLATLNETLKNNPKTVIAGPVKYTGSSSFLHHYQCMESAVLMALTADAFNRKKPMMANGANLCVNKAVFLDAQASRRDLQIPGGDDVFLLEYAMQQNPNACMFLGTPENTVQTLSEKTWHDLFHQRTRWASKVRLQKDYSGILWQLFSLLFALLYFISLASIAFLDWHLSVIFVAGKMAADIILLNIILPKFNYRIPIKHQIAYSVFQVFMILYAAIRSTWGKYSWKGRQY